MKKLLFLFCFFPFTLFSQSWQWESSTGSSPNSDSYSICTDGSGNCYVAENSTGQANLLKYNSSGALLWNVLAGNSSYYYNAICYANNYLYHSMDSVGMVLVSQYDTNGNLIWRVNCGSGANITIAADNSGHIYIGGGSNTFLAKLDTSGNLIWNTNMGGAACFSVGTDNTGSIYVTGYFQGTQVFGSDTLTSLGVKDIFIAKYDTAGICRWAKRAGGNFSNAPIQENDYGHALTCDQLGHLYVTGSFVDTADFDADSLIGSGGNDLFIAKYDTSGNEKWVKKAGGWSDQEGRCVTMDFQGNVLVGGSFVPVMDFGSSQLNGWGNYDAFVAKYDTSGNFISVITAGEQTWDEYIYGICADATGNIFVAGTYSLTTYFGIDSLSSQGNYSAFVGKIDFTTGIEPIESHFTVLAFPNPATTNTTFQMEGMDGNKTLIIYDQLGKEIWRKETTENEMEFSTENFSAGLYFYRIEQDGEIKANGKLIIE